MPNTKHYAAGAPGGKGGQFAPKNTSEAGQEQVEQVEQVFKSEMPRAKKPAAVLKENMSIADMFAALQDLNSSMQVGALSTAQEIEDNIEKFFSKNVIEHIDSLDGKSSGCASYQFHPKSNPWVSLNLYTCVLGKYRYPNNHAHFVNAEEFDKVVADTVNFQKVYRGITSTDDKMRNILNSYCTADIDNLDIYGNGMYGTNVYTTTDKYYASSYSGSRGTLISGFVEKSARHVDSNKLYAIRDTINYDSIRSKVNEHLKKNGLSDERADQISRHFATAIRSDISLIAILLGYDYQVSDGHQRNILNLNKWHIRKEF